MGQEIERKFRVADDGWRTDAGIRFRQGYLCAEKDRTVRVLGTPFKFADHELAPFRSPPLLGQHTDDVLHSVLGLAAEDIAALREAGTVR